VAQIMEAHKRQLKAPRTSGKLMKGEVTYTIDQGQLASLAAQYRSRPCSTNY
jgi:hypothetical protein